MKPIDQATVGLRSHALGLLLLIGSLLTASCSEAGKDAACGEDGAACVCQSDADCRQDEVCRSGECSALETRELIIEPAEARGCEVLLVEQGARVRQLALDESVRGVMLREDPRVALSFMPREDRPFQPGSLQLRFDEGSEPKVERVHCADSDGVPLPNASAILQD